MNHTIHIISHTHWDREWYLTFQQFRLKLVHLVDGLLDLMANDPHYRHFMLDGQTIVLDDYLHMRPDKEDELRAHVQSGRILIGPWHILPDMFLVSPEAHVRNLLQGERTARRFGPKMQVGYIPDPFGHPGQVPQILQGFGIPQAVLWRGVEDLPCEFWWQSPDGSRVLMAFLRDSYGNGASLPAHDLPQFTEQLRRAHASLQAYTAAGDVLVMLGTDHMEPPPHTSDAVAYADAHLSGVRVQHSTLPAYLESITRQLAEADLPVVTGELRACSRAPLLPGVLSTRMWIKQRNRLCESLLEKWAEPFSVFAARLVEGLAPDAQPLPDLLSNPAPILRQTWRLLMENHPHDSICGCSIDQVHDEMKPRFDQVEQIGEEITRQSLQTLSSRVDTRREGALCAVVVFNPTGTLRTDLVEAELSLPEASPAFELVDESGRAVVVEPLDSRQQDFANLLIPKRELHDLLATIHDGRVAGQAIVQIAISRQGQVARIEAVLDEHAQPNLAAWERAAQEVAVLEADPAVTQVHILARTPRSSRVRFVAGDVPAHGWRTYWARPAQEVPTAAPVRIHPLLKPLLPFGMRLAGSPLGSRVLARLAPDRSRKPPFSLQNEFLRLEADPHDGTLTITDQRTGAVYHNLHRFVDGGDAGDEYNYSPPLKDAMVSARVVDIQAFPDLLPAALEIRLSLRLPRHLATDRRSRSAETVEIPIFSRLTLAPGVPRLEIHTQVENTAEDHRLRVHFPAPFQVADADYDGHFEVVQRPLGMPEKGADWVEEPRPEVPQRLFTDVSDGRLGLMVANRGLPEVEVCAAAEGTEICLTLLRCVGWLSRDDLPVRPGHAGPGYATPGAQLPGTWHFDYAVIPHAGGWQAACHQAYALDAPLRAAVTGLHTGELTSSGSFIVHSPPEFVLSAVKETEDGSGWIVRGCNLTGAPLDVSLKPLFPFVSAAITNLAEAAQAPLTPAADGALRFPVREHGIVTVRLN